MTLRTLLVLPTILISGLLNAQTPGTIDFTFNPTDPGFGFGDGADSLVRAIVLQPDGKVIIGGDFTSYHGTPVNHIARLNADGSLDETFDIGSGASGPVRAIALQPDGKVIIGGNFTHYNGTTRRNVARLNADGSLDASFSVGTGANFSLYAIALQPDGKILIGGTFTFFNGTARNRVARLNANGSLDTTFNVGTGANDEVWTISVQSDGRMIIGGQFTSYNGTQANHIARLQASGSIDGTFVVGEGANLWITTSAVLPDGKIIIGGGFTSYDGIAIAHLARLNADGTLDGTFDTGSGPSYSVRSTSLQSDGKLVIGGTFGYYDDTYVGFIARIHPDGALDSTFMLVSGLDQGVHALALQPDGKVLIGGYFKRYGGAERRFMTRLNADGTLDEPFAAGTGVNRVVYATTIQADGRIVIGGHFTSYGGSVRNRIARLLPDGSLDSTFNAGPGTDWEVLTTAVQPDGKVIIGGWFHNCHGVGRNRLARLNEDGSLDTTFQIGSGFNGPVYTATVQNDGKIVLGGTFTVFNGDTEHRLSRLNADGSEDPFFYVSMNTGVYTTTLQPDDRVIVGAAYSGGSPSFPRIIRVMPGGVTDQTFNTDWSVNHATVRATVVQPDGKVIAAGNASTGGRIVRLHPDGSVDEMFNVGTGADATILAMVLQPNGKIILGGEFTSFDGMAANRIARLHPDGSFDTSFDMGTGADGIVHTVALQEDGRVIVAGEFTSINGIGRNRIARLHAFTPCEAGFTLHPDTTMPQNWFALNTCVGTPPMTYEWNWGDGTSSTGPYPSHTYSAPGYYNICVSIADAEGCMSSFCDSSTYIFKTEEEMITITVTDQLPTPVMTTPEVQRDQLQIFPNPVTGILHIIGMEGSTTLRLLDIHGRTVLSASTSQKEYGMDVSHLTSGVYLLAAENSSGRSVRRVVVSAQ